MSKAKELGSSLLSQKRERDDRFRNRQESFQKRRAWTELLLPPVIEAGTRAVMTSNIEEFDNNSTLIKENQDYRLALENAQTRMGINKKIQEDFGGNAVQYFANIDRDEAERRAIEALNSEGMDIYAGNVGPYKEDIGALIDSWAEENADKHNEAMALVRKIGTPEEYTALVKLNRSKARSDDLFGSLFQKGVNYVRGTSQEEIDARAIKSIENSSFAKNADALNIFEKEYNKNRNVMQSYDFAKFATDMKDGFGTEREKKELWTIEDEDIKTQTVGNVFMIRGSRKWKALNNPERKFIQTLNTDEIDFNTYADQSMQDELAEDLARAAYRAANFHTMANTQLNPAGVVEFNRLVVDKTKNSLVNIEASADIITNLKEVSDIYSTLSQDPVYLKSEVMDSALKSQIDLVNTEVTELLVKINDFKTSNPAYYKQEFEKIIATSNIKLTAIYDANKEMRSLGIGL